MNTSELTRREFLGAAAGLLGAAVVTNTTRAADKPAIPAGWEPVIDFHQHTHYSGRTNEDLIKHQQIMGVDLTVLLPAGRFYGLDAQCEGNESVYALAHQHPDRFVYFATEVADLPEAPGEVRRWLRRGAIGIGEQKFQVACDSPHIEALARIAERYHVPMILHFQHGRYNTGIEKFHRILERFPKVAFVGHAQTWWANIGKDQPQDVLYPKGPVKPGGITDQLLSNYPNMYGDLSAGSGLNSLTRDEAHTRSFLERHQDQLLFGSDCDDRPGSGKLCQGNEILAAVRRLAPNKTVERKILFENSLKLLKVRFPLPRSSPSSGELRLKAH